MKKFIYLLIVCWTLTMVPSLSQAQCALCQAQVQTNTQEGNTQAAGLNSGILYLMATPYLIALGIGIMWFRKYRKKDVLLQMKNEPIHLN